VSAPEQVRTSDGVVWEKRAETRGGLALYAVEGVCRCPQYVMATLAELAEHGLQSTELAAVVRELGALPMPAGPVVSVVEDPSGSTVSFAPGDDPFGLRHAYRVPRDLPEPGGAR
jgi:hypothetical protein